MINKLRNFFPQKERDRFHKYFISFQIICFILGKTGILSINNLSEHMAIII